MKKRINDNLGCLISIAFVAFIVGLAWAGILSLAPPDVNKAEKLLESDGELLETVVNYLKNSDENIYIHKYMPYDDIEDEAVKKAIKKLFFRKYDAISKYGNTIEFLRWTRWKDFGAGIAYSINGEDKPVIEYVIKLEPLSKDHWYYFEEN